VYKNESHELRTGFFYSPTMIIFRDWFIPVPFINYGYNSENLVLNLGVPTMIMVNPRGQVSFTFQYFPPYNVRSALRYRPLPFIIFSAEYELVLASYLLAERQDDEHKLYREYHLAGLKFTGYVSRYGGFFVFGGRRMHDVYFYPTRPLTGPAVFVMRMNGCSDWERWVRCKHPWWGRAG
jgi:hypothetical protein